MKDQATETGLDEAREGIDAVDDEIHALLLRRAELVRFIGSAKRGGGGAYRPAREARILRRLLANNKPSLDFAIVYRLWREMIGGFTAMQAPLRVSVPDGAGLERLARDHFGAAAIVNLHETPEKLIEAIRNDPSLLAIVPISGWTACLGRDAPNVIAALPVYGDEITALCLSASAPQDSGNDLTLFAVAGGEPSEEALCLDQTQDHCLIVVDGFHVGQPEMQAQITADCGVESDAVTCIGAFPAPIQESST